MLFLQAQFRGRSEAELYRDALEAWGLPAQVLQLAEESAELAAEALRVVRDRSGRTELAEEIADVLIMIEQMKLAFPGLEADVNAVAKAKLDRLAVRLISWREKGAGS